MSIIKALEGKFTAGKWEGCEGGMSYLEMSFKLIGFFSAEKETL